jgi:hypothetical protein
MSKRKSNKPEPGREGPEIDLEPIRRVYESAIKVLRLGKRWLLTEPFPSAIAGDPQSGLDKGHFFI